jgi:hypothetical protein
MIAGLFKGTPWEVARRCVRALLWGLLLALILVLVWPHIGGGRQVTKLKAEAAAAGEAAKQAQAHADSADAGATNATETRKKVDAAVEKTRTETKASVERIKNHAPAVAEPVPVAPVDADLMRELEAGNRAYRAAADRLLGTGAR